jgi:RimJ/RimL family protein N-acetyltransferase
MLTVRTKRLRLLALTAGHLRLYLADPRQLEEELDLQPSLSPARQALRRAIGLKLTAMDQVDERWLPWHAYWLAVIETVQIGAGLAGFKGPPNDAGLVEIGYGIEAAQRRQGYAVETVGGLIEWAFATHECRAVTARTQATNEASAAVLRKAGFHAFGSDGEQMLWRIVKEPV